MGRKSESVAPARVTRLHLAILMHYSAINEPYSVRNPQHALSPATKEYTQQLVDRGLVYHSGDWPDPAYRLYRTTERGQAYLDRIIRFAADGAPGVADAGSWPPKPKRLRDEQTVFEFFSDFRLHGWMWLIIFLIFMWR